VSQSPAYPLAAVGHLAIQILGPLTLWDVDDDGVWRPLPLKAGGGAAGLLATFIFFRREIESSEDAAAYAAAYLWDAVEIERDPRRFNTRFRKHMSRLRKQLGDHSGVLTKGRQTPGLTGRASQNLLVDWWHCEDHHIAGHYATALSLFRGLPLREVQGGDLDLHRLRDEAQEKVEKVVYDCLSELKAPFPDSLDVVGPLLRPYAAHRPPEWIPAFEAARHEAPLATGRSSRSPTSALRRSSKPPPLFGDHEAMELFEPCVEGEERLALELDQAREEGSHTWWSQGAWLGQFFAFWLKMNTRPCEDVALTLTDDRYDAARFGLKGADKPKDKATIIEAPSFYGDNPEKEIVCGVTNWGLAYEWAKLHGDEMLEHPSRPSIFGVVGRPVFPGIAGVHALVQTSDGYVLFGLRAPDIAFHERTWSATFEEQVAVGAREFTGPLSGDENLRHAIEGGLYEEWGIDAEAIQHTSCLAIGREWRRSTYRGEPMLNLSATVLTACRLDIRLADVWARLDESAGIEDVDEHRAWAGVRFGARSDVLQFVARAKGHKDNENILEEAAGGSDVSAEVELYPGGTTTGIRDRGLMPTSAARLVLASGWFETLG
jgi:hypothetical protein